MRKILAIMIIFIVIGLTAEIKIETVREIEAERALAGWIESILEPIIGETIVIANLTLEYPASKLRVYGSTLDKTKSLPGLPIAKSKSVMPTAIDDEETYPTRIVKKEITVYIKKTIDKEMKDFLLQNVALWLDLKPEQGDKLNIQNIQTVTSNVTSYDETAPQFFDRDILMIFALILLILIFLFIVMFLLGMNNLSKAVKNISISDIGKVLRVKGNLVSDRIPASSSTKQSEFLRSDKPIPIKLVDKAEKQDYSDFHFLEKLSLQNFQELIDDLPVRHKCFILTNLAESYTGRYLATLEKDRDELLAAMFTASELGKEEIKKLYEQLFKEYSNLIRKEQITFDGYHQMIKVLNYLKNDDAKKMLAEIEQNNPADYQKLREEIFLLEDIDGLSNDQINLVLQNLDYTKLAKFLKISSDEVREKFLSSLTPRAEAIIREEISFVEELTDLERNRVVHDILMSIRRSLGYI